MTVAVLEAGTAPNAPVLTTSDVRFEYYRSSGPGGQHRNKTDSAVRATHVPTGVVVCATESRSQGVNRVAAVTELSSRLAELRGDAQHTERNEERRDQTGGAHRAEVTWTWNDQRGEVTHHPTGKKLRQRDALRGKF